MKKITGLVILIFSAAASFAQKKELSKGNDYYIRKDYDQAISSYQNALKKNPNYLPGIFNLGNALYQQKNYEASRKAYENYMKKAADKKVKSSTAYNIGNTYMAEQQWEKAIASYKEALRKNPQDVDAKYNLSYALEKMKQQQGGGGKNDKNQDKKENQKDKNENKDKENQNQNDQQDQQQNKDEQQDQQNQDQESDKKEKQDEQQRPQPQPSKLSEKEAAQILNALAQEEKKLHDKKEKQEGVPVKVEKDW